MVRYIDPFDDFFVEGFPPIRNIDDNYNSDDYKKITSDEMPDIIFRNFEHNIGLSTTEKGISSIARDHFFGLPNETFLQEEGLDINELFDFLLDSTKDSCKDISELQSFLESQEFNREEHERWNNIISLRNYESTCEIWATRIVNAIHMIKPKLLEENSKKIFQLTLYLQSCYSMLVFEKYVKSSVWSAYQISKLSKTLDLWQANKDNSDESFWQTFFTENEIIFSQLVPFPIVFIKGSAYIGGETTYIDSIDKQKDGRFSIADFLIKNKSTENVLIVEIKTPSTNLLLKGKYRGNYKISSDLTGSCMQISSYKNIFMRNYNNLVSKYSKTRFSSSSPQCIVIAGNSDREFQGDYDKIRSFELFRNELKDIKIVTYDELFEKTKGLLDLLREGRLA